MTIETKYNIGDKVFIIENNRITQIAVHGFKYESSSKEIEYSFLKSKGLQLGDKNSYIHRSEKNVYSTLQDLISAENIVLIKL